MVVFGALLAGPEIVHNDPSSHIKGAFTDVTRLHEEAFLPSTRTTGTLFINEFCELLLDLQAVSKIWNVG
jgi:DNA-binding NtrC family response regulator